MRITTTYRKVGPFYIACIALYATLDIDISRNGPVSLQILLKVIVMKLNAKLRFAQIRKPARSTGLRSFQESSTLNSPQAWQLIESCGK